MTRTPLEYFERIYDGDEDPWRFASSWYEQRKYSVTLACLPGERYRSAFEPGCSIGVLSEGLAARCDRVLAVDQIAAAVAAARRRLRRYPHVQVGRATLPQDWPHGPFDLLVLSELAYYFDRAELGSLAERAVTSLEAGATVAAVHWRGETDYPLTAAEAHALLGDIASFEPVVHHVDEQFLLDVWRHRP